MALLEEFRNFARENSLFTLNDRILLAVSGGIDSMVMLHLFIRMKSDILVAHCNFNLRGTESDLDEELVGKYAAKNHIPFISVSFDTSGYAAEKGISIQMAARDLRYDWFEKQRSEQNCTLIAVAHNLNDNIETMLINLIRGTGLTGLTGMKPSAGSIIRPLLFASRASIGDYCSELGIPYREDRSNSETLYTRNKIRHLVIPVLREINPSVEETLNATAKRLAGLDKILSGHIEGIRSVISSERGQSIVFDTERLGEFCSNKAMIFELFHPYGITDSLAGDLQKLIGGDTGKQLFTRSHRILKNRDEIIVSPLSGNQEKCYLIESVGDLTSLPWILSASVAAVKKGLRVSRNPGIATIDMDMITLPLIVRRWKKGDWFYPLGMGGRKKLSDYFADRKFSRLQKEEAMILESAGKIVWVMGERLDDRFKVTESTTRALIIELNDPEKRHSLPHQLSGKGRSETSPS